MKKEEEQQSRDPRKQENEQSRDPRGPRKREERQQSRDPRENENHAILVFSGAIFSLHL